MSTPNDTSEIPYGYCHCGCGQKTSIARLTIHARGQIKGQPHRFATGHHSVHPKSIGERFWKYVDKSGGEDACWLWTGGTMVKGYGVIQYQNRSNSAHRISWMLAYGDIPDGLWVLHNCPTGDNPRCVNPKHLWLGTRQDNVRDMWDKGRGKQPRLTGEAHGMHKLTQLQVDEIRLLYSQGGTSFPKLGRQFGVSTGMVFRIVRNKAWKTDAPATSGTMSMTASVEAAPQIITSKDGMIKP